MGDVSGPLPFGDGEFTSIVCTTAFHHFPKPRDTIAEMSRVLAPRGRVVIADANRRHPAVFAADIALKRLQPSHFGFRSPGQLMRDLGAAGFAQTSVCTNLGPLLCVRPRREARLSASRRLTPGPVRRTARPRGAEARAHPDRARAARPHRVRAGLRGQARRSAGAGAAGRAGGGDSSAWRALRRRGVARLPAES